MEINGIGGWKANFLDAKRLINAALPRPRRDRGGHATISPFIPEKDTFGTQGT